MIAKYQLQKSWIWNKKVEDFVAKKIKGYSLNICAGKSTLGSVRLDLDPKDKSIIKGDMRNLPFPDNTFDTVICDPPWKIDYFNRFKPFFECVRVCKVGGVIIYNATWIPESKLVELKEVWVRQDGSFTTASIIGVFKKCRIKIQ